MKFRSNNCMAVHLADLKKAEAFYSGVLGFRLLAKTATQLEYDTGRVLLYVKKSNLARPPVPSFSVINARQAKAVLEQNGCEILEDGIRSLSFKDPFGFVYELVED
jgi:catechol 2,3-dioxygenase-like lactoylglutathione lyase family enzyme